jgi:hypothetical protein
VCLLIIRDRLIVSMLITDLLMVFILITDLLMMRVDQGLVNLILVGQEHLTDSVSMLIW